MLKKKNETMKQVGLENVEIEKQKKKKKETVGKKMMIDEGIYQDAKSGQTDSQNQNCSPNASL